MSELIEYADVDMDIPVSQFYLNKDEITDEVEVQWKENVYAEFSESANVTTMSSVQNLESTLLNMTATKSTSTITQSETPFWLFESPTTEFDVAGGEVSCGFNFDWNAIHAEGRVGIQISTIHVTFKVRPAMLTTLISVDTNCRGFYNGGIYAESGGQIPLKLPTIIIPISGPLVFQYTLAISLNYTAAVGMETELSATAKVTADASYTPLLSAVRYRMPKLIFLSLSTT